MATYQRLARAGFDGRRARDLVAFMDTFVRLPGNTGFDATIDRVEGILRAAGYRPESEGAGPLTYRVERRPLEAPTWEPVRAVLRIVGDDAPLLTLDRNPNLLALRSWSTPPGGVDAGVVDVGRGRPQDFEGRDVRGKVVYGEARVGALFREAVRRGAIGVIAYYVPALNRPEEHRDVISYQAVPLDTVARSWGLQLTTAARDRMREALAGGPVRVHVETEARFYRSEERTLVAEVRGAERPDERFVFSAHVQEAGANDNASGVAALAEIARLLAEAARSGAFTPRRTITMLWGDEIRSTRRYVTEDAARASGILWGMSLDMVGEDTRLTGGTFLIEKMPDPSAVWTRGDDRHTEWGGEPLDPDRLVPHYLNDFVLRRCRDQGADNGWVVRTNPFEGGSDHVPFLRADIPAVLLWHFTDVFYHTDGDRLRNVSPTTLTNVGVCAAVSAMTLSSADLSTAVALVAEVEAAALQRLATERTLSVAAVAEGANPAEERRILGAWTTWYDGALASMTDIEVGGPSPALLRRIEAARLRVQAAGREAAAALR